MKKLKTFTILFLMFMVFFSCEKNFEIEPEDEINHELISPEIGWAKEWLEQHYSKNIYLKSGDKEKKKVTPAWSKGKKYKNNQVEVYEIPLNSEEILGFATEEILDIANNTGNNRYLRSETRLLIQKFKKSDVVTAHFMIVIGSPDYMGTTDFNLKSNTYLKKDKDFSGYVVFYELDGRLNTGYKYLNGKITHRITEHGEGGIDIELKNAVPDCTKINVYQDVIGYHYEFGIEVIDYEYTMYIGYFMLCSGSGDSTGSDGGDVGTTIPDSDSPCLCDICPVCGGCLSDPYQLKSLPLPGEDGETVTNINCIMCPNPELHAEFDEHPCLETILNTLMSGTDVDLENFIINSTLTADILNLFDMSETVDLTIKVDDLGDPDKNGTTRKINGNNYEIVLNETYINSATDLSIARTMIHEIIHANLLYRYDLRDKPFDELVQIHFNSMLSDPSLTDEERANITHHTYMANNLIPVISDNLYEWCRQSSLAVEKSYCDKLSWGGLDGVPDFEVLPNKSEIVQIILNEKLNNYAAEGRKCKD